MCFSGFWTNVGFLDKLSEKWTNCRENGQIVGKTDFQYRLFICPKPRQSKKKADQGIWLALIFHLQSAVAQPSVRKCHPSVIPDRNKLSIRKSMCGSDVLTKMFLSHTSLSLSLEGIRCRSFAPTFTTSFY